jgi:serine/threonine protein kinase/tetratricopeptide (TPR) repeat protein
VTDRSAAPDAAVESLVGRVADEFTRRLQQGDRPDVEDYAARYPQLADLLRQVLSALQVLGSPRGDLVSADESPDGGGTESRCLGDFRLRREVGRGGMGVVYEAEQVSLGRRVALKVLPFAGALDARQLQRFRNEAQAAAHLHHTNIVPVISVGCERGVHYYAMQFIEGQSLADLIQERLRAGMSEGDDRGSRIGDRLEQPSSAGVAGKRASVVEVGRSAPGQPAPASDSPTVRYSPVETPHTPVAEAATVLAAASSTRRSTGDRAYFRTAARLGVQAAEALEHAHQLGVVHRDVKPANLLVDGRGNLWVTDFGLAQFRNGPGLTMTGDIVGTLRYMSPEQALAQPGHVDHRTDVYSLGATLYELLTLKPTFDGADRQELLRQIAFEEPCPPRRRSPAIPAELETIILKALAKSPGERYGTAQELADDLSRYLNDQPIRARRATLRQVLAKWARRHRGVVVTAGVAGLCGLLLAVVGLAANNWLIRQEQDRTERALQRAELNVQLAMEALDNVYLPMMEERLPRDRRQVDADRRLLGRALDFYQDVARANGNNPRLRQAVMVAWQRVGEIEAHLGHYDEGKRAHRRAIDLGERLAAESPTELSYRRAVASSHDCLASLLRLTGDRDEAARHLREAVDLGERLIADFPAVPDCRQRLANSHDQFGQLLHESGELAAAEEHYQQAQTLRARLAEDFPDAPGYRQDLAGSHNSLGNLLRQTGQWAAAEQHYRRALDLKTRLAACFADLPVYRRTLAMSHRNLADLLARRDREESARHFRLALDLQARLAAEFPAVPAYRLDLADTHGCLGRLMAEAGNRAAAAEHFGEAFTLYTGLAAEAPSVPVYRQYLAITQENLGKIRKDDGDVAAAQRHFRQALELERPRAGDPPPQPHQRECLAITHYNLGGLLAEQGDPAAAEPHLREALAIRTRVAAEFPKLPQYCQYLADSHRALGDLFWHSGDRGEAADHYRQALDLWTALTAEDSAGDEANARNEFAWFLATCPDLRFRNPARSVALARKAVEGAPQHGTYWNTLGAAHYRAGDAKAAAAALEKSVQLRQGGDCFDWLFLALAYAQLGDPDKARAWYEKVARMDNPRAGGEELRRLRAEVEGRLGLPRRPTEPAPPEKD